MATMQRLVGRPGAGKTQFLRNQVAVWTERDGIDPADIVCTSHTRAAAAVLRGRVPVPEKNCATTHSLANRSIEPRELAEKGKLAREWNDQSGLPESWKIGAAYEDLEEGMVEEHDRGKRLSEYALWRATLWTNRQLEETTRAFAKRWEAFKRDTGSQDFEDMIETATLQSSTAPGNPRCLVVDEAQDLQPSQLALLRQWAEHAEHFLVAGDPAQTLYGWIGADPNALLQPMPASQHRLLSQSHRLPRTLDAYAERWLSKHSPPMCEGREYRARDEDGVMARREYTFKEPDSLVEDVEAALTVDPHLEGLEGVTILAACSYMLGPTIKRLRAAGIPFHNPGRRSNGAWNPLGEVKAGKWRTQDRLRVFLEGSWTGVGACSWLELLPAAWYTGTKKGTLAALEGQARVYQQELVPLLHDAAVAALRGRDVGWLAEHTDKAHHNAASFLAAIYRRYKAFPEPRVTIGTIHSYKGNQASTVLLYPDVSRAAMEGAETRAGRDALVRQWYVGCSRAYDTNIIYSAANPMLSFEAL